MFRISMDTCSKLEPKGTEQESARMTQGLDVRTCVRTQTAKHKLEHQPLPESKDEHIFDKQNASGPDIRDRKAYVRFM